MKKAALLLTVILMVLSCNTKESKYNILNFGASPGTLCTDAIQRAVDQCHEAGGGCVTIPAGTFITGTIELKSNVELWLDQGAILKGSEDLDDYTTNFRKNGIIYCFDQHNVTVSGHGTIDATGTTFYDTTQNHTYDEYNRSVTRQGENYQPLDQFSTDGPIKRRPKPGMSLTFYHCTNVRLMDVTIRDTPSWAVRFAYCENVHVRGITIRNNLMVPNSDGVHCTASRNVVISDCDISAGDDAIIVTGFALEEESPVYSMDVQAERKYGNKSEYSENFTVTNCVLQSRSAGIRVGYGQHPIRRCVFSNIIIHGSNRGIGVFAHDLSDIEDLQFSNITIHTRLHNGQWWGNGEPIHLSSISRFEGEKAGTIRRVRFRNIIATSENGILVYGDDEHSIRDIEFDNISLRIVPGREMLSYGGNIDLRPAAAINKQLFSHDIPGLYALNTDGLLIDRFNLEWGEGLADFYTDGIYCKNVQDLYIWDFFGTANPTTHDGRRIRLENSSYRQK
ncbi:MAG: right-handed parallel beta-helix repeat-containing protein [Bacteroidales bacterium]|nr:right-handed parallel beta-helix repeat-containing protein [Bacteroidales bacterium]